MSQETSNSSYILSKFQNLSLIAIVSLSVNI